MLEKEFQALGFNMNEKDVYLALVQLGKASPVRIAKETGINRTTVYSISRKLISLGLVGEDLSAKAAYLYAERPEALRHMFAKEETALHTRKALAETIAHEIAALPSAGAYSVPRIKFVEETDLSEYLYSATEQWVTSGMQRDNLWWGYHDDSFTSEYREWIEWCWKRWPETHVRLLSNKAEVEERLSEKYAQRITRTLPDTHDFDSSLWVIGDYVLMVQTRERPHYLVEIHDAVFARNQRQLFKSLWNLSSQ